MNKVNVGVYRITCTANGRVYFGSSTNLRRRLTVHRRLLVRGDHGNIHIQSDWNRYGPDAFDFKVLIRCDLTKYRLLDLENFFIHNHWDNQISCYNVALDARAARLGCTVSNSTRIKLSKAAKGNTRCLGRRQSEEAKAKMSVFAKTRRHSEETRAKIGEAQRGRKASDEARIHMSEAMKGQTRHLGHKHSEETRAKMSESSKAAWAKRRSEVEGA